MKNALLLHATNGDHTSSWLAWLKKELIKLGYKVSLPDLPGADHPNIVRYNEYLLKNNTFDNETILVGHSSGAVEILGLLNDRRFPRSVKVKACFLVGAFRGSLGWESLKGMAGDFNYSLIKQRSSKFIFIHSDNDPYCPLESARELSKEVSGKFIEIPGQGHFTDSLDPKYKKFPKLLEIIEDEV